MARQMLYVLAGVVMVGGMVWTVMLGSPVVGVLTALVVIALACLAEMSR